MKISKKKLYELPDIMGEQLSPKEFQKKMELLDKEMKIAIAKYKASEKAKRRKPSGKNLLPGLPFDK